MVSKDPIDGFYRLPDSYTQIYKPVGNWDQISEEVQAIANESMREIYTQEWCRKRWNKHRDNNICRIMFSGPIGKFSLVGLADLCQ